MGVLRKSLSNVLILAGDTDGNLGDRAIVRATCDELHRMHPGVIISIVSGQPDVDAQYFNAVAIPRGARGLPAMLAAATRSDLVLVGGGGLFQDDDSLIKMPYWALRVSMVRLLAHRIEGYSIGAGPLRAPISRLSARLALACMRRVSVRDEKAKTCLEGLTSKTVVIVPDPAILLRPAPREAVDRLLANLQLPKDDGPLLGVSLRRWFHQVRSFIPHKYAVMYGLRRIPGERECDVMTTLIAEALDRLVADSNVFPLFMPSYTVSHEADDRICRQVMGKMRSGRHALVTVDDPRLYMGLASRLRVMIGMRMHPCILASSVGTPVIGIAYNQKFSGFFRLLNLEHRVLDVNRLVHRQAVDDLVHLVSQCLATPRSEGKRVAALQKALCEYNELVLC